MKLFDGIPLIDEHFVPDPGDHDTEGRGMRPRDWEQYGYGAAPFAAAFVVDPIPRSEWAARIEFLEKSKADLHSLCLSVGFTVPSQGQTSSCWAQTAARAAEVLRIKMGEPFVRLSAASIAGPINNYRDRGGWEMRAMEFASATGFCTDAIWPNNAVTGRQYATKAADAERENYKVIEWGDARARSPEQLATMLLTGYPCCIGRNRISHETLAIKLVKLDGTDRFGTLEYNTGYMRDNLGYTVFDLDSWQADDVVIPRTITAA